MGGDKSQSAFRRVASFHLMTTTLRLDRVFLTFDIVDEESARNGDVAHSGFCNSYGGAREDRENLTLRNAIEQLSNLDAEGPIECDSCPCTAPRWFTKNGRMDGDGNCESLSLHVGHLSPASARRVARLIKPYGFR